MLEQLVEATNDYPDWAVLRQAIKEGRAIHLAVMVEPYLTLLLEGKKQLESRFSRRATAPFKQIEPGDLVLLKLTGGPIVGCFTAKTVECVLLDANQLKRLRQAYTSGLCANDEFWQAQTNKRYATIIGVSDVRTLQSARIAKLDRRGWMRF